MNHDPDPQDMLSEHHGTDDGGCSDYPIGLPDAVFRLVLQGVDDFQEGRVPWRIRAYLQISLREAASHAEISAGYLWRLEHGQRHARQWTLAKLCLSSLSLSPAQTITILRIAGRSPA